jgi:hypothetical protein
MSAVKHPCPACGEHLTRNPICARCEVKYQIYVALRPNKTRAAHSRETWAEWAARKKKANA